MSVLFDFCFVCRNYRSLAEFFTRQLREDVRIIDKGCLVSPCDGRVLHFGTATNCQIEQVKGVNYNIESFLGPSTWTNEYDAKTDFVDNIKENKVS